MIESAAVVVPVHDEEVTLPACLAALAEATARSPVPVTVTVVLDRCSDASAAICRAAGATTVTLDARNVGRARRSGVAGVLAVSPEPLERLWVATTDGDSVVPPDWLADQVRAADLGADAHVGTIELAEADLNGPLLRRFSARYRRWMTAGARWHPHVHGANLGVRASAYLAVGGFPDIPAHEDRLLVERLERHPGVVVRRSTTLAVRTSGRSVGRAPTGLAADLLRLGSLSPADGTPAGAGGAPIEAAANP